MSANVRHVLSTSWVIRWSLKTNNISIRTKKSIEKVYSVPSRLWDTLVTLSWNFANFEMISTTTGSWWDLRRDRIQPPVVVEIISKFAKFHDKRAEGVHTLNGTRSIITITYYQRLLEERSCDNRPCSLDICHANYSIAGVANSHTTPTKRTWWSTVSKAGMQINLHEQQWLTKALKSTMISASHATTVNFCRSRPPSAA